MLLSSPPARAGLRPPGRGLPRAAHLRRVRGRRRQARQLALQDEFDVELGRLAVAEVATRDVVDGETGRAQVSLEEIGLDEIPVGDVFVATDWSDWVYEAGLWRASELRPTGRSRRHRHH